LGGCLNQVKFIHHIFNLKIEKKPREGGSRRLVDEIRTARWPHQFRVEAAPFVFVKKEIVPAFNQIWLNTNCYFYRPKIPKIA
jgi:hypothetical protein